MFDHLTMPASDVDVSMAFYEAVLPTLGPLNVYRDGDAVGFGPGRWAFGLVPATGPVEPVHLAFAAPSRASVRAFYAAALSAGGTCNGPPGPRTRYGPTYFAAYAGDPDGHRIEAVCRNGQ